MSIPSIESVNNPLTKEISDIKKIRLKYPSNIIASFININSIRNKLNSLEEFVKNNVDVLAIAETKIDNSFTTTSLEIEGYSSPFRLDYSKSSGGLLVYIDENIPSKLLNRFSIASDLQILPFELNFRKQKWLILVVYKPPRQNNIYFLNWLGNILDFYLYDYDSYLLVGDFNLETGIQNMESFMTENNCYSLIKEPTCFKSITNPSCIDLFLTNKKHSFQCSKTIETGLSDYHRLILTVFKTTYKKLSPKKLTYRSYKTFCGDTFLSELSSRLDINCSRFSTFIKVSCRVQITF